MSKSVKSKEEANIQMPESKWHEELKSKEALEKKVLQYQEKITVLNEKIEGLEKALGAVTEFNKASDLTEGDKAELKMAREAYKSFSFIYEDDMWHFEFYCDPMVKKCDLFHYKRLK